MSRIAIIGTGISGLGAAYLLHSAGHDITVYEKNARAGGHTRTLDIDYDGAKIAVDTGFIVFNLVNYPHLCGMFKHLDVTTQKSDMTLAITIDRGKFEWGARNLNAVFGQRRSLLNPAFYTIIRDVMRFNREAKNAVILNPLLTLGELIALLRLGEGFKRYYLLPMGGAIWSTPPAKILNFPASAFVHFFENHGLLSFAGQHQWYTVTGGSQCYVEKLIAPFRNRIKTDCGAVNIQRQDNEVEVLDSTGARLHYDRVVFACHADEILDMLRDATPDERQVLSAFTYQRNIAYLHRDASYMPKRKACWASWVYQADNVHGKPGSEPHVGVTYWMNLLQSIDHAKPLFVTLNPTRDISPAMVFDRHEFHHPVFTRESLDAQKRLPVIQGTKNSWYCGAYTRYGFHEDGLLSAVNVAQAMGAKIPWL